MSHAGTTDIETSRLKLRRFCLEDAEAMYAGWATDPQVTQWMRWEPHKSLDETRSVLEEWVKQYENAEFYVWAMERKEDGPLMGSIGILPTFEEEIPQGFEPGYCIGREWWNQGYTSEALQAVVSYFFSHTKEPVLYCLHATGNPASGRVMEKAGFRFWKLGQYKKFDGSPVPARIYRMDNPFQ